MGLYHAEERVLTVQISFLSQYRVHTQIARNYSTDTEVNCPHFHPNRLLALEVSWISFKYWHTHKVLQVQALSIKSWHLVMTHLVITYLYSINAKHLDAMQDVLRFLRNIIYLLNRLQNSDTPSNMSIPTWGTWDCSRSNLITKPAKMKIIF